MSVPAGVTKALQAIGMSKREIAELPQEDIETLSKAIPDTVEPEDIQALAQDEDVQDAVDRGDAEAFASAVETVLKSRAAQDQEEDEDEDDEDLDGEDDELEDEEEDEQEEARTGRARSAMREMFGAGSGGGEKRAKKTRKSLAEYMAQEPPEDESEDEYVDAESLIKGIDAALRDRERATDERLEVLAKGLRRQGKKLDLVLDALERVGMRPAGRALPYTVRKGALDGGDTLDPHEATETILKAQAAGIIDPTRACGLMKLARAGGEGWDRVREEYEQARKALEGPAADE